jgi:hypothetical protein
MTESKTVRCGITGCDWRVPFVGLDRMDDYRAEFRLHCVERHALAEPDDSYTCFDLDTLIMELWRRGSRMPE